MSNFREPFDTFDRVRLPPKLRGLTFTLLLRFEETVGRVLVTIFVRHNSNEKKKEERKREREREREKTDGVRDGG